MAQAAAPTIQASDDSYVLIDSVPEYEKKNVKILNIIILLLIIYVGSANIIKHCRVLFTKDLGSMRRQRR